MAQNNSQATTGTLVWFDEELSAVVTRTVQSVGQLIEAAECVRDLKERSNYRFDVSMPGGGTTRLFVKRTKPKRRLPWAKKAPDAPEAAGMLAVREMGVRVPSLVCTGTDPRLGSITVTRDLAPAEPLDDVMRASKLNRTQRRAILFRLARQIGALHDGQTHHRDLYLNHVFVNAAEPLPSPTIIDWDRYGTHRGAIGRWVIKDLAALYASARRAGVLRTDCLRFLSAYMTVRHLNVDAYGGSILERVLAKAEQINSHVPRTPVGDAARPLTQNGEDAIS